LPFILGTAIAMVDREYFESSEELLRETDVLMEELLEAMRENSPKKPR
jgi:hypothetical protein